MLEFYFILLYYYVIKIGRDNMERNKILMLIIAIVGLFIVEVNVNALSMDKYQLAFSTGLPGREPINGWRFAQKGASEYVPCGMALYITECWTENDTEVCNYSNRNIDYKGMSYGVNHNRDGIVLRDKLSVELSSADNTCDEEEEDTEYGWRYASNAGIRDTVFPCGARLYITSCYKNVCNFSKYSASEYEEEIVNKSGTVNRDYLAESNSIMSTCTTTEEKEETPEETEKKEEEPAIEPCVNKAQPNIKGTHTFNVCYDTGFEDEDVKRLIEEKGLATCGVGYVMDTTATKASGNANCNAEYCSRDFTVTCNVANVENSISLSATPAVAGSNGQGKVTVKATSNNGKVNGYYVSEYYEAPTMTSEWNSVNSDTFNLDMYPGVKYLWVKDNNGTISNVITVAVIDEVTTNTTIKTLKLTDASNNAVPLSGITYKSDSVNSGKYVKMARNLTKGNENIADGFNPFASEYRMKVNSPTITVYATLTSEDAEYVAGFEPRTVNLNYGVNTVLIKIKNKEGKIRTYTLIVTREDDRSSDNTLRELKVSAGNINFNANSTEYIVEIPENTTNVNVSAKISSDLASYISGYEPGNVSINGRTTTKLIKVKSQTGSTRTYAITFIKKGSDIIEKKSLQLSGLTIPGINIPFESKVANYSLTVGYDTDVINVYAALKDKHSSVAIRVKNSSSEEYVETSNLGIGLGVGANIIEIEVKDKDNNTAYYVLTIIRKEFGLDVENKTALKDLTVAGYDIKFDPNKKDYSVKIKTEKSLVITAVPLSNRAEVFIRGNDELTGFSTVRVKVVAENGDYDTYSIDIKKDAFNKRIEIIAIIAGGVIILLSTAIIVIKKKIKAKKDYIRE